MVSLIPGGLYAAGFAATAAKLTAIVTVVGTAATIGFGLAAPVLIYDHTRALKACTNKECRINEGLNIAETLLDVIDFASLAVVPQSLALDSSLSNKLTQAKAVVTPTNRGVSKPDVEVLNAAVNVSATYKANIGYNPVIRGDGDWGTTFADDRVAIVNHIANQDDLSVISIQQDFNHNALTSDSVHSFRSAMSDVSSVSGTPGANTTPDYGTRSTGGTTEWVEFLQTDFYGDFYARGDFDVPDFFEANRAMHTAELTDFNSSVGGTYRDNIRA